MAADTDPRRCPLCAQPNACAMAAGGDAAADCWCRDARFPPALLARVPADQQGRACVCAACVEHHHADRAAQGRQG